MPYRTPIESLELKGWTGGLNREADPFLLEQTESPDCLNVDFGLRGEVSKRKGYAKYSTNDLTAAVGQQLKVWQKLGGSEFLIMVDETGDVFHTAATDLVDPAIAFGAGTDHRSYGYALGTINDKLYLTSLRTGATPHYFDGTAWTALLVSPLDGTAGSFPRARDLVEAHDRMFAFNVTRNDAVSFRSRMYYSNPLNAEKWEALDYIDFAPDDGQEITGAVLFGEQIIVFKNRSVFALAGTDENNFTVYPIDKAVGTSCPDTIVTDGPVLFFFDHETGVWSFDGTAYSKRDDKINEYLLNGVNEQYAHRSYGSVYRGRYYLCVPWGDSQVPNRTFVYDGRIDNWTEYDFAWRGAAVMGATVFTVGTASRIGIFRNWLNDSDAGDNIAASFATSWLSPQEPSAKHRVRRLDLAFSAEGDFNVTAEMRRDFVLDAFASQLINTSPGGALWDSVLWDADTFGSGVSQVLVRTTGWGTDDAVRWRVCQFVFSENTTSPFQINRMVLQISKLDRLRGEP